MIILPDHFYFSIDQTQNLQKIPTLLNTPGPIFRRPQAHTPSIATDSNY